MTVDIRPDPLTPLRSILDEADWDLDDADTEAIALHPVTGWVPTLPPDPHHCRDGICAEFVEAFAAREAAADERTYAAWARDMKADIRRAKTARGKKVKALRRQVAGQP